MADVWQWAIRDWAADLATRQFDCKARAHASDKHAKSGRRATWTSIIDSLERTGTKSLFIYSNWRRIDQLDRAARKNRPAIDGRI